jgi:ubiquinone/menaquinone biosynthesis C-methylase UbiE
MAGIIKKKKGERRMAKEDHRFDPRKSQMLLDAERQAHWEPQRFLTRLKLKPGQHVLDIGSGPGFWTMALAEIVGPSGVVWALDVSQELLDILNLRHPPAQVHTLQGELPHTGLPDDSFDLIWAAFVWHEVKAADVLATEMSRLVCPGGRVAVLDWRPDAAGQAGPPKHHRVAPQTVIDLLLAAGFKKAEVIWKDEDTYLLVGELDG